jgi:hypothetical protein
VCCLCSSLRYNYIYYMLYTTEEIDPGTFFPNTPTEEVLVINYNQPKFGLEVM